MSGWSDIGGMVIAPNAAQNETVRVSLEYDRLERNGGTPDEYAAHVADCKQNAPGLVARAERLKGQRAK